MGRSSARVISAIVLGSVVAFSAAPGAVAHPVRVSAMAASVSQTAIVAGSGHAVAPAGTAVIQGARSCDAAAPSLSWIPNWLGGGFINSLISQMFRWVMSLFGCGGGSGTPTPSLPEPTTPQPTSAPEPKPTSQPQPGEPARPTNPSQPEPKPTPNPANPNPGTPNPQPQPGFGAEAQAVLASVNAERAKAGAAPLVLDKCLTDSAAQPWANEMARSQNMRHQDLSNVSRACPGMSYVGENIAMGYKDAAAVMNGWMNSSGHRANILNRNYTHLGLAVAKAPGGQLYWCQNFGRR